MKNPLYAYRNFEKQFRQAAKEEIEKQYIGYEHAAFRDLLAFLGNNSSTIGRWRLALITGLIKAEELARLIRKLLMAFPTANLEKGNTRDIALHSFKRHMLSLLAHNLQANAEAIAESGPPGTLRLRLN